jgi:hypothetical protein
MLGPVQVLIVAVDGDDATTSVLASAAELGPDAPVRCLDAFEVEVDQDGQVEADPGDHPSVALFAAVEASGGVAGADGATWSIADAIAPGTRGVVLLLEHRWAIGLVGELRAAGATLAHEAWLDEDDRAELESLLGGETA